MLMCQKQVQHQLEQSMSYAVVRAVTPQKSSAPIAIEDDEDFPL